MLGAGDPAKLGRGPLTRWLPVLWQASPHPPPVEPFLVNDEITPPRFQLRLLTSAKRLTVPAAALSVIHQVGEALVPVIMGIAIDRALATGDATQLVLWLVLLGANFLMLSLAFRFAAQFTARATELVQHRLRATLSKRVLHPVGGAERHPDGGLVSVMTNDVSRMGMMGLAVFPIGEFAGIVFIAVSLLLIYWPLGLIVLIGAPVVVGLMGLFSGRYARDSRIYQTLLAGTVGRATDLVAGYRVIKGVGVEGEATRRYREASQETLTGAYRNLGLLGRFLIGSETIAGAFVAAVAGLAGLFAINGQLTVGGLIAVVGLTQTLLPPMQMLTNNAVPLWAGAVASSGRVLDLLKESDPGAEIGSRTAVGESTVELTIPSHGVIRVEPGEIVGLQADDRTGTDIANALLHPAGAGRVQVTLDALPAAQFDRASYRQHVVVAPHHTTLFSGTVTENLTTPGAPPALHDAALQAAACDDFLTAIGGPDANVGEMGNRLSGGQRQRIALARALAHDAPVLVLHDPTTAVDSVTEDTIAARLRALRQGRTTIVIASSPALLSSCDRIVVLQNKPQGVRR